jgi:hypothetical protein
MMLAALIRGKSKAAEVATAIPAIPATHEGVDGRTVVRIATVAVANPTEQKTVPMTAREGKAIRRWLAHIEETDPVEIQSVLDECRREPEALRYYLGRAAEVSR